MKRKSDPGGSGSEIPFKIGKLKSTGTSHEEKMAKIRAISSRINQGVNLKPSSNPSQQQYRPSTSAAHHKHSSFNNVLDRRKEKMKKEVNYYDMNHYRVFVNYLICVFWYKKIPFSILVYFTAFGPHMDLFYTYTNCKLRSDL